MSVAKPWGVEMDGFDYVVRNWSVFVQLIRGVIPEDYSIYSPLFLHRYIALQ